MKDEIGLALLFTEGLGPKYHMVKVIMEQDDDYLDNLQAIIDKMKCNEKEYNVLPEQKLNELHQSKKT